MAKIVKKDKEVDDPCWNGYHQLGIKTKDGKKVPNCVPESKKEKKK